MTVEQLIPGRITHRGRTVGGSSYVGDQHRCQYPLTDRRLTPSTPATPDDRRQWFVADDPVVMPRWDIKDVPGPDLELGAVIHSAIHGTRQRKPHMMELAACCPGDGAHMLRPPPAGLQHSRPTTSSPTLTVLADPFSSERISSGTDRFFVRGGRVSTRVFPDLPTRRGTLAPLGAQRAFNVPTSHRPSQAVLVCSSPPEWPGEAWVVDRGVRGRRCWGGGLRHGADVAAC